MNEIDIRQIYAWVDRTISYINYCKKLTIEMSKSKGYIEHDYNLVVERYITLKVIIDDLIKIFGIELVEDGDVYKVVKSQAQEGISYYDSILNVTW